MADKHPQADHKSQRQTEREQQQPQMAVTVEERTYHNAGLLPFEKDPETGVGNLSFAVIGRAEIHSYPLTPDAQTELVKQLTGGIEIAKLEVTGG